MHIRDHFVDDEIEAEKATRSRSRSGTKATCVLVPKLCAVHFTIPSPKTTGLMAGHE